MPEPYITVSVAWSPGPREVVERSVQLEAGATLRQAVEASGLFPSVVGPDATVGVWGSKAAWEQQLRQGDRVEIYRQLRVDPKVARRERFKRQGARSAGLFAKRRPDGKPGY